MGNTSNDAVSDLMRSLIALDKQQLISYIKDTQVSNANESFLAGIYCYLSQRDHQSLRRHLNKHKEVEPEYLMELRQACLCLQQGQSAQVIEHVKSLTAWTALNPILLVLLAEAQYLLCDFTQAHHNFSKACRLFRSSEELEILARRTLQQIEALRYSDALAEGAMAYLLDKRFDSGNISALLCSLLRLKYRLDAPEADAVTIELVDLLQDGLLKEGLQQVVLADASLEAFLINLRRSLLGMVVDNGQLPIEILPFLACFAKQCWMNEYVFYVEENEARACRSIEDLIHDLLGQEKISVEIIGGLVLILGLYNPLPESSIYSQLLEIPRDSWPAEIRASLSKIVYQEQDELEKAKQLESITPISVGVSETVREQYEQNPYPRWSEVDRLPVVNGYLKNFQMHKPPYSKLKFLDKPLKMLVAGCGTGRESIGLALAFPEIEITAVDLSRRSLAYASLKAEEIGVTNVRFFHGDILKLGVLKERFHIIECAGVLHHMENPEAGLKVLRGLLAKNGIFKLAFYSKAARKEIDLFRSQNELESSRDRIRELRRELFSSDRQDCSSILQVTDFYTTSMCRDLLFHVQEHCVDLQQIESLLQNNGLAFRGFSFANPAIFQSFQHSMFYSSSNSYFDLQAWHRYEQQNPMTFIGMYQFFTQAI